MEPVQVGKQGEFCSPAQKIEFQLIFLFLFFFPFPHKSNVPVVPPKSPTRSLIPIWIAVLAWRAARGILLPLLLRPTKTRDRH